MVAVIRFDSLENSGKSVVEYGLESALKPKKKMVRNSDGSKHMVYVDYVFKLNQDHAVNRQKMISDLGGKWINPRFKTESDWQTKRLQEFVLVDGIKVQ